MSLGLIGTAMAGAMEGAGRSAAPLANYASHSQLQKEAEDAQALRDARLSEIRKGEIQYAEDLKRKPYIEADAEANKKIAAGVGTDANGAPVNEVTDADARKIRQGAYRSKGLINEALQMEGQDLQRENIDITKQDRAERAIDRDLDRNERKLDRESRENHQNAMLKIQAAVEGRLAKGAELDNAIKQINVDNAKRVDSLRQEFKTAPKERQAAISEEISILTGKDTDKFLPLPTKDDQGNVTGYQIFDTKKGDFVEKKGATAAPSPADIEGLRSRAKNPQAVQFFESKYGKGSAAKVLESSPAAVATFKDPLTGQEISAAEWKRKYGEAPKRTETEMRQG